jgi:hypothetical protein
MQMNFKFTITRESLLGFFKRHGPLLVILLIAGLFWAFIFAQATIDFVAESKPFRASWIGVGQFDVFGMTIHYDFEGWADYDYYYQSWADNFLNGIMPYSEEFDTIIVNSIEYYTPYFLPPLYVYLCAAGRLLMVEPYGIGLLITSLGYLTAFPIYSIAHTLSRNIRVGQIAALSYLFNPLILFHTAFQWLNPAPFVFFMMLSFSLLVRNKRLSGVIAMVSSAMLKQVAFFLAIPLIGYFIKRPPSFNSEEPVHDDKGRLLSDNIDLHSFLKVVIQVLIFVGAISLPYLLNPRNYLFYLFEKPGGTLLTDVTSLPSSNQPVTLAVLFILFGAPAWLTQIVNLATFYSIFLMIGLSAFLVKMLLEKKDDRNLDGYWRRILFYTLLLMLWVHIFSPRGIYKYYCVALIPFFCILSTRSMLSREGASINTSVFMILNPFLLSLGILFPSRLVYLLVLIVIMLGYVLNKQFSLVCEVLDSGLKRVYAGVRSLRP